SSSFFLNKNLGSTTPSVCKLAVWILDFHFHGILALPSLRSLPLIRIPALFSGDPLMELDLDSILHRHSTAGATTTTDSDSDDDVDPSARRTVDDILNESDTSSSSPTPSFRAGGRSSLSPNKRDHYSSKSDSEADEDDVGSVYISITTSTAGIRTAGFGVGSGARNLNWKPESPQLDDKKYSSGRLKYNLLQRYKSDDFSAFSNCRPPVPSLFGGGVRSSAKPGAALAAAAAASRSIPTPHAAAIKSRRAMSVNLESKASVGDELLGFDRVSVRSVQDDVRLDEVDDQMGEFQNALDSQKATLDLSIELSDKDVIEPITSSAIESSEQFISTGVDELGKDGSEKIDMRQELAVSTSFGMAETSNHEHEGDQNLEENNTSSSSHTVHHEQNVSMSYPDWDVLDFEESKPSANSAEGGLPLESAKESRLEVETSEIYDVVKGRSRVENEEVESISDDITRLVEDRLAQLESERSIKRTDEKLQSLRKSLEVAEELEKKQASTGLHLEEGAAAQPMRLEGIRRGSTVLGYFDVNAGNSVTRTISSMDFRRDHGSPEVLAVHHNYIAVGTSKGVVLVLPSKYSVYNPDNMDSKISFLGQDGDKSQASVTSLCFNLQGDMLLAGYGDGHITLWDLQRSAAARIVTGEHKAPVVHSFFLGQKAVTGDCKGLLLLHTISVVPLLGRLKVETQCLLDGQRTGTVLCASPLIPDVFAGAASINNQGSSTSFGGYSAWKIFSEGTSLSEEGVVVFITYQTALVVRLTPSLEVYSQLSRPEGVREGSMPYAAWKCTTPIQGSPVETTPVEASEKISWLAIAWDRKVQIAKLVKSDLKVCGNWTLDSVAIGLTWLDDQVLVILTLTGQLCLYTRDGKLIHQTSYAADRLGGEDLIAYHTHFSNSFGNPEKSYHNCVALRGASIYILGPAHLVVSRLLPWKERIQVLRKAGDWMGALNMAMTLYDGEAHGVIDLPISLDSVQEAIMPYLMELLFAYVDEVFSYISVACNNQIGKVEDLDGSVTMNSSKLSEIKEQFTRVGGVAVEFCVHIKRTDILFEDIFSKFIRVHHKDTFLELLEPYILKDMLGSLPPEIMQALVEHYNCKGWLQRVEQCVLHMDISSLDFNQVVRLCREHGLYGALIYLFNKGLDDFRTPLEELVAVLRDSENEVSSALGYRMLVYLKYCFTGLAFPPGHGTLPSTRIPSLRAELIQFLLQDSGVLKSRPIASIVSTGSYINLYYLLELDTEATLEVLKHPFVEYQKLGDSTEGSSDSIIVPHEVSKVTDYSHLLQKTVDSLVHILHIDISRAVRSAGNDDTGPGIWPSRKDIGHVIEFIATFVACKRAIVSKSVLSQILEYLISENNVSPKEPVVRNKSAKKRENQVLALLDAVPETDWNDSYVLHLCENAEFYQVCGLIHSIRQRHLAALDSFLKDIDEPVYAFSFINTTLLRLRDMNFSAFRLEVISRIPELTILSRECTLLLIIDHLNEERGQILSKLRPHPRSLFLYLKTIVEVHVSGTLKFPCLINTIDHGGNEIRYQQNGLATYLERVSGFPKLLHDNPIEVSEEMIELYFELLCQFEPDSVLKFLETYESYRVENCLRLCQHYGVVDGAVFLLERVGDVGTALQLTLSGINNKFMILHATVETIVSDVAATNISIMEYLKESLGSKETQDISKILRACIGLCQRNTPRLDPDESEILWFELLDTFCRPLILFEEQSKVEMINKDNIGTDAITWKIPKARKSTPILKRLFAQFIKEIVEGMIRYVRLPSIMSKLLADKSSQEFGDFKLTILGMLGTYGFERRILDTAKSLIEDDIFYTLSLLKKGASRGYAPINTLCCVCNCPFNKSSAVRVFNCGHATHMQCEQSEDVTSSSQSFSSGCPICAPKKKIQNSTSKMVQHGQVNRASSRPQQGQGALAYEADSLDNNRGMHQFSRFEILYNLQKNQRLVQLENVPQLRLAPPAVYHEKVVKGITARSSSSSLQPSKNKQITEIKAKTPSIRFPLRSKIFGKEKSVVV
ncbi:hypothetical protein V2J09_004325, partial [Rumex salicifolius]